MDQKIESRSETGMNLHFGVKVKINMQICVIERLYLGILSMKL